jgi:hypothetical protein
MTAALKNCRFNTGAAYPHIVDMSLLQKQNLGYRFAVFPKNINNK